jgi:hypothetical protein
MVTTVNTTVETRTQALQRLARVARESGVKLMRDSDGAYWATSVSEPGWLYRLEPDRCGCRGFAHHRRCRHLAALLSHLGYLDDPDPDPAGGALPDCAECHDAGVIDGPHSRWVGPARTGFRDTWTTAVPCPVCAGELAA